MTARPDARVNGTSRRLVILLVEDNAADADLTREALADSDRLASLHVARDGADAIAFLRRQGQHADAPSPDLILLDLNLPGLDGRAVLTAIRGDPALREIPVVMLTSSSAPQDVSDAYRLGANCYVTKPLDLARYLSTIRAIEQYWSEVATLPG